MKLSLKCRLADLIKSNKVGKTNIKVTLKIFFLKIKTNKNKL